MASITRIGVALVGCAAMVGLTACSSAGPGGESGTPGSGFLVTVSPGAPTGSELPTLNDGPAVAWIDDGTQFAVVTMGSSSCPPSARDVVVDAPDRLTIVFEPSPNEVCTADYGPTTHAFTLPTEITQRPITVVVDDGIRTELTLD